MATSKYLKPRRGSTAEHSTFKGEAYEITFDTDKKTVVAHDGLTMGGFPLAHEAAVDQVDSELRILIDQKVAALEGVSSSELAALETSLRGLINLNAQQQTARDAAQDDALTSLNSTLRALIAEEVAKYLPLAGGVMTGDINLNDIGILRGHSGSDYKFTSLYAIGDNAAGFEAFTSDSPNIPSGFNCRARGVNGEYYDLAGRNDGTLSYNNSQVLLPAGAVFAFAGNSDPAGALLCNGAAVSRTTYARLFAAIGTTYGAGNGSTTFNLPDLRGRFIEGDGVAGAVKAAGLPEISAWWCGPYEYDSGVADGAWGNGAVQTMKDAYNYIEMRGEASAGKMNYYFAASRSNGTYGASNTVQPPALTMRYYIKY